MTDERPPPPPVPTDAILESISDGVFTVDLEWRITSFNRAAEDITGIRRELHGRHRAGDMVSRSPRMASIFEVIPAVAASDAAVLILGETGTGKELLARAVHGQSARREGPFVAINCGALPDTLLESELFGYRAGAFTGAVRDRRGRIARARGGTLFLDEVGEMSPAMQVRLLRVLEERTYEPLGSSEPVEADFRLVVATNRDLQAMIRSGAFREDLYYRIRVVQLDLPPLRERLEDVSLLVEHFVERFNCIRGAAVDGLDDRAVGVLLAHDWPGNVRELENVIEHAFVLCRRGRIGVEHLPPQLAARSVGRGDPVTLAGAVRAAEVQAIQAALRRCNGNREAAAELLGVHKSTLFRKARQHGLELPERDGRHRG